MGAYLSSPVTDKISADEKCENFTYGASSMQGWRMSQEDAHNCIPELHGEIKASLFAVYDGHGGAEVAQYTAKYFPDFLKSLESFTNKDFDKALKEAFLGFDATLNKEKVVEELKELAGLDDDETAEDEVCMPAGVGRNEADILRAEANMPLDEVLEKYDGAGGGPSQLANFHKKQQIQSSPALKPKMLQADGANSTDAAPSSSSNNRSLLNNSASNHVSSMCSFAEKLSNGCADNENNLNKERELAQRLQSRDTDSEAEASISSSRPQSIKSEPCAENKYSTVSSSTSSGSTETKVSENKCVVSIKSEAKSNIADSCVSSSDIGEASTKSSSSDTIQPLDEAATPSSSVNESQSAKSIDQANKCSLILESRRSQQGNEAEACSSVCGASSAGKAGSAAGSSNCSSGPCGSSDDVARSSPSCDAGPCGSSDLPVGPCSGSDLTSSGSALSAGPCGSSDDLHGSSGTSQPGGSGASPCSRDRKLHRSPAIDNTDDSSDDDDDDEYDEDEDESDEYNEELDSDDEDEEEEEEGEIVEECDGENSMFRSEEPGSDSGCTAVVALLYKDTLIVANAGDSRCVLSRKGVALDLSEDHKPEDDIERKRIEAAGGSVTPEGRVNGGLNLSRALGDHCYKKNAEKSAEEQMITSLPDIQSTTIGDEDEFAILACDGIWNYMTSQEVVDFIRQRLKDSRKREQPSLICEELFDYCLAPNTMGDGTGCDNMTCIIVTFDKYLEKNILNNPKRKMDEAEVQDGSIDGANPEKRAKLEEAATDL